MKYSVEIENGVAKETLVFNGKEYARTSERVDYGFRSRDNNFYEQLENDGIDDEELLDHIDETIDGFFIGDLMKIAESEE